MKINYQNETTTLELQKKFENISDPAIEDEDTIRIDNLISDRI